MDSGMIKPLMGNENNTVGGSLAQGLPQLMATQFNQYSNGQAVNGNFHANRYESFDDKHIISKHNAIYPSQDEVNLGGNKVLIIYHLIV